MKRATVLCITGILILSTIGLLFIEDEVQGEESRAITNDSKWLIVPLGDELTLHGIHTFSEGVIIDGTLNVAPYDGTSGTGKLTIKAPSITVNGFIDASGRGYGGGGGGGGGAQNYIGTGGTGGSNGNGGNGGDGHSLYSGGGGGGSNNGQGGSGYNSGGNGDGDGGGNGGNSPSYNWEAYGGQGFGSGGGGGAGGYIGVGNYSGGGGSGGGGTDGASGTSGIASTNNAIRKGGDGGNGAGPYGGKGGEGKTYSNGGGNGDYGRFGVYVYSHKNPDGNGDKSTDTNVDLGSGGGGGAGSADSDGGGGGGGGAGGGAIILNAANYLNITGSVLAKGAQRGQGGYDDGGYGGGGAGGGISLSGYDLNIDDGVVNVRGGDSSGSGTVKLFYHRFSNSGSIEYGGSYGRYYSDRINEKPMAVIFTYSNTVNIDEDIKFYAHTSHDPDEDQITSYYYDFGDNTTLGWTNDDLASHSYEFPGDYEVTLKVKDTYGDESDPTTIVIHVNYPPTAKLTAEPISGEVNELITFSAANSFDMDGEASEYYFDYGDNTNSGWIKDSTSYHIYSNIGAYYVHLKVIDNDEAMSENTAYVRIDISVGEGIEPPPDEEEVSDKTTISYSKYYISGDQIYISEETDIALRPPQDVLNAILHYKIDGGSEKEYQEMFQLGQISEGKHIISYWSTSENWTEPQQSKNITYDVSNPSLSINYPENGAMIMNSSIDVTWAGSDYYSGIKTFNIRLDDGSWTELKSNKYTLTRISDGEHIIYVKAEDNLVHNIIQDIIIKLDLSSPELTILSPTDGMRVEPGSTVQVSWMVLDKGSGLMEIMLSIDGIDQIINADADTYTLTELSEGTHIVILKAKDKAGNTAATSVAFTVSEMEKEAEKEKDEDNYLLWVALIIMAIALILVALTFIVMTKPKRKEVQETPKPQPEKQPQAPEVSQPSQTSQQPAVTKPKSVQQVAQQPQSEIPQQPPKVPQLPQPTQPLKLVENRSVDELKKDTSP